MEPVARRGCQTRQPAPAASQAARQAASASVHPASHASAFEASSAVRGTSIVGPDDTPLSAVVLKRAKRPKNSVWVMGSNLWVWHWAQPTVAPSHTAPVVATRSMTACTRFSSSFAPPSWFTWVLRWKPVAMRWARVALGARSPAS